MTQAHPLDELRWRGLLQDVTDEGALRTLLTNERVSFYVGFDPTAPSLHIGNLVGLMTMSWLQRYGHRPIVVLGGATGRIGDPSGRDSERELLDVEIIASHLEGFRRQAARLLDLSDAERGLIVDNYEWTRDVTFLDFLRDVGKHFSINQMIARESVKVRLEQREQGISFTEFSYMLLQAWDFANLFEREACRLQGGGSDQWGNIVAGVDLTRRLHGGEVFGYTWPLLTASSGRKFGKSEGNATWLDAEMTSPYAYYQHWVNTEDADVVRFLKTFTFLPRDEIDELARAHEADPAARVAHRRLAQEATRVVHGDDAVADAERATTVLFGNERYVGLDDRVLDEAFASAPSTELARSRLTDGIGLLDLLFEAGAATSLSEGARLVRQGGVYLNNERLDDDRRVIGAGDLVSATTLVVRVGKKRYFLIRFT